MAKELEPTDDSNDKDLKMLEEVIKKNTIVQNSLLAEEYFSAIKYLNFIMSDCPASVKHCIMKIECLVKLADIDEALKYTATLIKNPYFPNETKIIEWRGRVLLYAG